MTDPILEWYASPDDDTPLTSWDYGTVDAGTTSAPVRFHLYNNKNGTGASTATDLTYTTLDSAEGGEQEDVVRDRWLQVEIVAHHGNPVEDPGGFQAVGGEDSSGHKDLSAYDLPNGASLELDTRITVPAQPAAGVRSFVHRVAFKFT